jgi:dienelactone hydrolase
MPAMPAALIRLLALVLSAMAALGCAAAEVSIPAGVNGTLQLPAEILKPDGPGPFPAIVVLHDCSGLGPRSSGSPRRWADQLVDKGYVAILPDSFTPRGHAGGICTVPPLQRHGGVTPVDRANDAYATLTFLRTLPYVDANRIGVMGGSHGGASTLATMVAPQAREHGFLAAAALYPACAMNMGGWHTSLTGDYAPVAPVHILIGELDDWTPAENCRRLAEAAQRSGHPVTIKVYPGAHHSFDSANPVRYVAARVNVNAPGKRGATTGGQAVAWADSIREVVGFFGRYLGK